MDPIHRKIINSNLLQLIQSITLSPFLIDLLLTHRIFNKRMIEDILAEPTDEQKKYKLLVDLCTRGPKAFNTFLKILSQTKQLQALNILNSGSGYASPNGVFTDQCIPPASLAGSGDVRDPSGMSPRICRDSNRTIDVEGGQLSLRIRSPYDPPLDEVHYNMTSNPQGFCVIINNVDFCEMEKRCGSDLDAGRLSATFGLLGFRIVERRNLTAQKMRELLESVAKAEENEMMDALVVIILTHGGSNKLFGTDGGELQVERILGLFDNVNAPRLQNKPKMFFIQACRGKKYEYGTKVYSNKRTAHDSDPIGSSNNDLSLDEQVPRIPSMTDFIIAYSTIFGYTALRNTESGSWFGNLLVSVLLEHAYDTDLFTMLLKVEERMRELTSEEGEMQSTEVFLRGVHKKVYFNTSLDVAEPPC